MNDNKKSGVFKTLSILDGVGHLIFWLLWGPVLYYLVPVKTLNPELEGWGVWKLVVPILVMVLVMALDLNATFWGWFPRRYCIVISLIARTLSVVLLFYSAWVLLSPLFRQLMDAVG